MDFPAPFSPTSPSFSPGARVSVRFRSAHSSAPGVPERDVVELDRPGAPARRRPGRRGARLLPAGRDGEVVEQVRHEQGVLVQRAHALQHRLDRPLSLPEHGDVEGEVAERDLRPRRAARHERVHPVERRERERPEAEAGAHPAQGEPAVLLEELREQGAVAGEDEGPEPEELHLLHVAVAGEDPLEVVEPPPLGRAPGPQPERVPGEAGLGEERGHRRGDDHEDAHRRDPEEEPGEGRERHRVLRDPERLHHERQRARRGLPPRVLHLVVDVGVLEVTELQLEGLLQDPLVHPVPEDATQELAPEPQEPAGRELDRHEQELRGDEPQHPLAVRGEAAAGGEHDPVHDELADPGDPRGQQGEHRGEGRDERGAAGVRLPHEAEGPRDLPEDRARSPEPLAQRLRGGRRGRARVGGSAGHEPGS